MKKKKIILPILLTASVVAIFLSNQNKSQITVRQKVEEKIIQLKSIQKRLPSSVKKKKPLIVNNREVVSSKRNAIKLAQNKMKINRAISKKWKELAIKKISQTTHKNVRTKIKKIKSVIYVKHGIGKYAEHVLVELFDKDKGVRSSFQAYIDSNSGKIIQTWSPTRFENYKVSQIPKLKVNP